MEELDQLMFNLSQRLKSKSFALEVAVNFKHWIPKPPSPYVLTLTAQDGPVTLSAVGEGKTMVEAFKQAQRRISRVLGAM